VRVIHEQNPVEREQPIEDQTRTAGRGLFAGLIRLKDGAAAPANVMDWLKAMALRDPFLSELQR